MKAFIKYIIERWFDALIRGFLLFVLSFTSLISTGQDVHFSMYNSFPLYINAANTGYFAGDWRIASIYRNQWRAIGKPYVTEAISFDKIFLVKNKEVGGGVFILRDESGSPRLTYNKIYFSGSLGMQMDENYFNYGIQIGIVNGKLGDGMITPSQWDPDAGTHDPDLPTGESSDVKRPFYADVNVGVLWRRNINIYEPEAGLAISHLNHPKLTFYSTTERLPLRLVLHTKVKTKLSDKYYITPSILLVRHKAANETLIGANGGINIFSKKTNVKEIFAGIYLRNGLLNNTDAFSMLAGTVVGKFEFAFSYDMNISKLTPGSSAGAFEFSIIYRSLTTEVKSYSIPCERL